MSEALPDQYLEEAVGGFLPVVPTSGGSTKYYKVCTQCGDGFNTYDFNQDVCDNCLKAGERK